MVFLGKSYLAAARGALLIGVLGAARRAIRRWKPLYHQ